MIKFPNLKNIFKIFLKRKSTYLPFFKYKLLKFELQKKKIKKIIMINKRC